MLKIIRNAIIAAAAILVTVNMASAKEIYILQAGQVNNNNLAKIPEYEALGYKVNYLKFPDCKAVAEWTRKNMDKEIIALTMGGGLVGTVLDPKGPAACDHPLFTEKNFVGTFWRDNYFLCTRKDNPRTLDEMIKADNVKIAASALNKDHQFVGAKLSESLGAKWKNVVLEGFPAVRAAMLSGDIDLMLTTDSTIVQEQKCYFTTADKANYEKIMKLYPNIPALFKLPGQQNSSFIGSGVFGFYLTNNTDNAQVVKIVRKISIENPDVARFYNGKSLQNPMMTDGYDPKAHYKEFKDYMAYIKSLM